MVLFYSSYPAECSGQDSAKSAVSNFYKGLCLVEPLAIPDTHDQVSRLMGCPHFSSGFLLLSVYIAAF